MKERPPPASPRATTTLGRAEKPNKKQRRRCCSRSARPRDRPVARETTARKFGWRIRTDVREGTIDRRRAENSTLPRSERSQPHISPLEWIWNSLCALQNRAAAPTISMPAEKSQWQRRPENSKG